MSRVTPGVVAERESAWILKGPRTFCLKRTRGADFWGCLGSEGKGEVSRVGGSAMTGGDHSLQWGGDGGGLRRGGSADEEQTVRGALSWTAALTWKRSAPQTLAGIGIPWGLVTT